MTVAVGNPFITSKEKLGPDKIAKSFFGKIPLVLHSSTYLFFSNSLATNNKF